VPECGRRAGFTRRTVATAWQQPVLFHAVDDHDAALTADQMARDRPAPSQITGVQLDQLWLCRAKRCDTPDLDPSRGGQR
jgi:hypothetical protein